MHLEFWFDFGSTYSYPAAMRIEALAGERNIPVRWRPFMLGAIFKQQGWSDSPFNIYPDKGRYMWRDMARVASQLQLPWHKPSQFPRNGLLAARAVCTAPDAHWVPQFCREVFRANFERDEDIASPEVIGQCLTASGTVAQPVLEEAGWAETKGRLHQQTGQAIEQHLFGAPSFLVGRELFWGNERLETALDFAAGVIAFPAYE
ncbi:2-hydroxychromene-2-carboxylate isomerase [uncultured Porticoccus sp.]|uniref:2-hydroxychromene-2-carboxylate isomerase n=1 Tax=uncultured Porticoccus sp. TaxID=1256050 RepID=UPI0030D99CFA|tara:strand:- start:7687 stop:8298 length:612 start_codon:yes stop_codon:yes gene_type:complete